MPQDTEQIASESTVKEFSALAEDKQRAALGRMSPVAKQALLAGIKKYPPTRQGATAPLPDVRTYSDLATAIAASKARVKEPDFPQQLARAKHRQAEMLPGIGATVGGLLGPEGMGLGVYVGELGRRELEGKPPAILGPAAEGLLTYAGGKAFEAGLGFLASKLSKMPVVHKAVENLFRALPSSDPGWRDQILASLWDLQRMAKSGEIPERVAGGVRNPEMYLRQLNSAIDKRLAKMFKTEYMGQIEAAHGTQVAIAENPEVMRQAFKWLSRARTVDDPVRTTLLRFVENPKAFVPIEDAAAVARAVNAQLREFEAATGEKQYLTAARSAVKAGMKRMDVALSKTLDDALRQAGQPGIAGYERRYAALSALNRELEREMNEAERLRLRLRPHEFVTTRGRAGLSLGSRLFRENPGKILEDAIDILRKSPDITGRPGAAVPAVFKGEFVEEPSVPATVPRAGVGGPRGPAPPVRGRAALPLPPQD